MSDCSFVALLPRIQFSVVICEDCDFLIDVEDAADTFGTMTVLNRFDNNNTDGIRHSAFSKHRPFKGKASSLKKIGGEKRSRIGRREREAWAALLYFLCKNSEHLISR